MSYGKGWAGLGRRGSGHDVCNSWCNILYSILSDTLVYYNILEYTIIYYIILEYTIIY